MNRGLARRVDSSATRTARAARRGFTLMEMVVVMIILAVGSIVALPAWRAVAVRDDVTKATAVVDDLFRIARDSAITSGRTVTVVVDSVTATVWMETEPRPGGVGFDVVAAQPRLSVASGTAGAPGASSLRVARSRFDPAPPGATRLPIPESVRLQVPRARARFTFSPGGQAFADSLVLTGVDGRRTITLDLGTGDVRVR